MARDGDGNGDGDGDGDHIAVARILSLVYPW